MTDKHTSRLDRAITSLNNIGDHIHSLLVIGVGALVALHHRELGELLIATGAAMWRGGSK